MPANPHDSPRIPRYRPLVDESLSTWFAREVLPHEAALMRYLGRICPNREDLYDLRQDIYVKIYEVAKARRPATVKPLLFTMARNLVIDRARHHRVVSIQPAGDLEDSNVLVDELSPERRLNGRQELASLAAAFGLLPPKCREVVWLRKVDDLSQVEVARLLNVSGRTVEFHIQKGMRILAQALFGQGAQSEKSREKHGNESEEG